MKTYTQKEYKDTENTLKVCGSVIGVFLFFVVLCAGMGSCRTDAERDAAIRSTDTRIREANREDRDFETYRAIQKYNRGDR